MAWLLGVCKGRGRRDWQQSRRLDPSWTLAGDDPDAIRVGDGWRSTRCTWWMSMPARSISVATECRRSWKRTGRGIAVGTRCTRGAAGFA